MALGSRRLAPTRMSCEKASNDVGIQYRRGQGLAKNGENQDKANQTESFVGKISIGPTMVRGPLPDLYG